jgi:hypothetical protein
METKKSKDSTQQEKSAMVEGSVTPESAKKKSKPFGEDFETDYIIVITSTAKKMRNSINI